MSLFRHPDTPGMGGTERSFWRPSGERKWKGGNAKPPRRSRVKNNIDGPKAERVQNDVD